MTHPNNILRFPSMPSSPRPAGSVADEMTRRQRMGEMQGMEAGRKTGHAEASAALSGMMTDVALELQMLRTAVKAARIVLRALVDDCGEDHQYIDDALGILERCERR